jgi:hypothetical protein
VYVRGRRWGWRNGRSQAESEEVVVDSDATESFQDELAAILGSASEGPPPCSATSAVQVMELYERCRTTLALPVVRMALCPTESK